MLGSCSSKPKYTYGFKESDQTIDTQSQDAHAGVEYHIMKWNDDGYHYTWKPSHREQRDNDGTIWILEKGSIIKESCSDIYSYVNGVLMTTGSSCHTVSSYDYVLDWKTDDGNIIGFSINGKSMVSNPFL